MSRRIATTALVSRHLRHRWGGGITVAALVLVLSLLATAAPIALSLLADAALRDRLGALSASERDVTATTLSTPQIPQAAGAEPTDAEVVWGPFLGALDDIRLSADDPLPAQLEPARVVTRAADAPLLDSPQTRAVTLAFDPAFADEVSITAGRMPEPATIVGSDEFLPNVRIEIVLSEATTDELEWPLGETRTIAAAGGGTTDIVLVGTFEATDPAAGYWQHATSVLLPNIFDDGNGPRRVTGTGFAHPASLPSVYSLGLAPTSVSTVVWYPFDPGTVAADEAEQLAASLRKFTSVSHPVGESALGYGILSLRFDTAVTGAIELALAQQASTAAVVAMVIAGPVGVAAAVLFLGCRLIVERRRAGLRLLSARGASMGQLQGLFGVEGTLVGIVPAAIGAVIASLLASAIAIEPIWYLSALIVGLAPVVVLWVLAPTVAERARRSDLGGGRSRARAIAEGVVAVLAIVSVTLLFLRGYADGGADLLLAATPLLLALAACLLTLRLYPIPLRRLLSRARRSPGLGTFVGVARAVREPAIGLTPVFALVVGVSVAVSSGVLLSALQHGVEQSAQAQIGADMRVVGTSFTREQLEQVRGIDGVAAATGISGAEPSTLEVDGVSSPTSVYVVEADELRDVQGESLGLLPPDISLDPTSDDMSIVVSGLAADRIGDSDEIRVGGVAADVVGVTRGPVPTGPRENWIAIDSAWAIDVVDRDPTDRTILVRLADGASAGAVADGIRSALGVALRIDTPEDIVAEIETGPAAQGVRTALLIATALAALLSALAIVMTLTLAAGPRARVVALLSTLGARRRISASLTAWEIGPPAVAAVIAGTVFGALVPLVVLAGVDLRPFTGSSVQPEYRVDLATLALTLGGFVGLAAVLTGLALLASHRIRVASILRTVEEG